MIKTNELLKNSNNEKIKYTSDCIIDLGIRTFSFFAGNKLNCSYRNQFGQYKSDALQGNT